MRHRGLSALSQAHRHFPARRGDARSAPTAIADAECRARTPTDAATTPATGAGLPRPAAATAGERAHADGVGDCPRGLRAVALKRAAYTNRASKVHYLPPSLRFPPLREGNRDRRAYSVPPACRGNLKELKGVGFFPRARNPTPQIYKENLSAHKSTQQQPPPSPPRSRTQPP